MKPENLEKESFTDGLMSFRTFYGLTLSDGSITIVRYALQYGLLNERRSRGDQDASKSNSGNCHGPGEFENGKWHHKETTSVLPFAGSGVIIIILKVLKSIRFAF